MRDDVVMMLTERGMRILIEEMRKGSQPKEVFTRLSQEELEPEQEEVDQLVKSYLDYKENNKPENYKEKQDRELREVIWFLVQSEEPQQLASIREHMVEKGFDWTVKTSTQKMQKLMKKEPNIINTGYGKYTYHGGETIDHSSEDDETGEVQKA